MRQLCQPEAGAFRFLHQFSSTMALTASRLLGHLNHPVTFKQGVLEMLKPGDKAPDFRLKSDEDKDVAFSDYKGRRLLIFLYPKANTSG